jgi:tetratricopeptide (TPR) repeat protein
MGNFHRLSAYIVPLCIPLLAFIVVSSSAVPQASDGTRGKAAEAYEAGMTLLNRKRYREALGEFRLVEQYAPKLPQGYSGEGVALALLGQLDEAQKALTRALEIEPSFWMARRQLGIVEWQLNERDEAATNLQEILKLFPTDEVPNSILGQYEFERGNYSQAAFYFSHAPVELESNPGLKLMAAKVLLKAGKLPEAKESLKGLSAQGNLAPRQRFELGWLLGQSKQYQAAINVFNSLPQDYPDQAGVRYGLALAYFEEGDNSHCIEILKDYKTDGVARPEALSLLGVAEEKSGDTVEAYDAFRQGIQQFPTYERNYLDLAALAAVHLNYDLGLQAVSEGVGRIRDDHKILLARGLLYSLKGQMDKAQADYEKALMLAPDEASIYVAMGMCYEDQNKYADAVAILQQAVQRQINDVLVFYFLADVLFRQGIVLNSPAYEQARWAVESCLRLDPEYAFAYLQRAKLELMSNNVEEAIGDLEHARTLEPKSGAILYQLGQAYRGAGRKADAEKCFVAVAASNKKEAEEYRVHRLVEIMPKGSEENRPAE